MEIGKRRRCANCRFAGPEASRFFIGGEYVYVVTCNAPHNGAKSRLVFEWVDGESPRECPNYVSRAVGE